VTSTFIVPNDNYADAASLVCLCSRRRAGSASLTTRYVKKAREVMKKLTG
jgi:hypothetical protein